MRNLHKITVSYVDPNFYHAIVCWYMERQFDGKMRRLIYRNGKFYNPLEPDSQIPDYTILSWARVYGKNHSASLFEHSMVKYE